MLQNQLVAELNRRGFETTQEMVVIPRDRVDVAVYPNSSLQVLTLIEVKTADPIRGVGQILSYQLGVGQPTHRVLVIDREAFNSQVARACTVAGIELWVMRRDEFCYITGPPILWNSFKMSDEPVQEYQPFKPGPVSTCPCCEGEGKVLETKLVDGQLDTPKLRSGDGTGVVRRNL